MLELITDLEDITGFKVYGSYKDLYLDMKHFNIEKVTIETKYCFKLIYSKRLYSFDEISNMSKVDNILKIKYQNMFIQK